MKGWALPKFAAAVPASIVPTGLARANAIFVQFLLDAHAIREKDIPPQWADEVEVSRHALTSWLNREIGELRCIAPTFTLGPVMEASYQPQGTAEITELQVIWFQQKEQQWAVGSRLEELEAAVPRLGATVLHLLDRSSCYVYPVFTPRDAKGSASHLYWYGEEDESLVLEEHCGNDQEAREAMRDDMVKASDFTEAFPEWALTGKLKALPRKTLKGIASNHADPFVRDVTVLALELSALRIKDEFRPDVEGEYIGFGAVLSWYEDDLTVRVYDDLLNYAHQSEFCDRIGEVCFAMNDPSVFRTWQRKMRPRFKAMRLIDRLIYRLSGRY